jgi:ABC-type multidrug transport system ATPase subunit
MPETNNALNAFLERYNELKDNLSESRPSDKEILMLFGTSGAGKSTFLSRVLSDKNDADFNELVISRDTDSNENVDLEGVRIGAAKKTSTIVPKRYTLPHDRVIYDVPGFGDNDETTEQVIQLMYRCLLSKVTATKYIIVIAAPSIYTHERKSSLETEYTNKLRSIFGEANFKKSITNNAFFVITQADMINEAETEKKSIKEHIGDLQDIANEQGKSQFALFLTAVKKNHFVVDYQNWDPDKFWKKYSAKTEITPVEARYNADNSTLMNQAEKILKRDEREMMQKINACHETSLQLKKENNDLNRKYDANAKKVEESERTMQKCHDELKDIDKFSKDSEVSIRGWLEDISRCEMSIKNAEEHTETIKATINKAEYVEQFSLRSVEEGGLTRREKVVTSISQLNSLERNIIVTTSPINIEFDSVEMSRTFTLDNGQVLYNDGNAQTQSKFFKCDTGTASGSFEQLSIKNNQKFYVTVVTQKKISKTMSNKLLSKVGGKTEEQRHKIEERKQQLKELKEALDNNKRRKAELEDTLENSLKVSENSKKDMQQLLENEKILISKFKESTKSCQKVNDEAVAHPFHKVCLNVSAILNEYNVDNKLSSQAEEFKSRIDVERVKIHPHESHRPIAVSKIDRRVSVDQFIKKRNNSLGL